MLQMIVKPIVCWEVKKKKKKKNVTVEIGDSASRGTVSLQLPRKEWVGHILLEKTLLIWFDLFIDLVSYSEYMIQNEEYLKVKHGTT